MEAADIISSIMLRGMALLLQVVRFKVLENDIGYDFFLFQTNSIVVFTLSSFFNYLIDVVFPWFMWIMGELVSYCVYRNCHYRNVIIA
jgi:hypothetical protein